MSNEIAQESPLQLWLKQNATLQNTYGSPNGVPSENDLARGYPKYEIYNLHFEVDHAAVRLAHDVINNAIRTDLGETTVKGHEWSYLATAYNDGLGGKHDMRIPAKTVPLLSEVAQQQIVSAAENLRVLNKNNKIITATLKPTFIALPENARSNGYVEFHASDFLSTGPYDFDNKGASWEVDIWRKKKKGIERIWDRTLQILHRRPTPIRLAKALAERLTVIAGGSSLVTVKRANEWLIELAVNESAAIRLVVVSKSGTSLHQVVDDPEAFLRNTATFARQSRPALNS